MLTLYYLIRRDVAVDPQNNALMTPLHIACKGSDVNYTIVNLLLQKHASPNTRYDA